MTMKFLKQRSNQSQERIVEQVLKLYFSNYQPRCFV